MVQTLLVPHFFDLWNLRQCPCLFSHTEAKFMRPTLWLRDIIHTMHFFSVAQKVAMATEIIDMF